MHRIDTPTALKDKFGAGKNGFTRGNPQTGTPATGLDDDYCDMFQEEICGVVEESGVALEKGNNNQLLTALRALLLSRKNPFGDIAADGPEAIATALANLHLVTNGFIGRLLGVQIIKTSGTYVPTPGTKRMIVECTGGGGGGGGSQASTVGNCSLGSGGSEGCYGKSLFENTADSYSVIVGAGGTTAVGAAGGQGGTTSFGDLLIADGGLGGGVMPSGSVANLTGITGTAAPVVTGANITASGHAGSFIYAVRINSAYLAGSTAGMGGRSVFGDGGGSHTSSGPGNDAMSFGAGGGGAKSGGNNAADAGHAGGRGGDGVVMVWEYV